MKSRVISVGVLCALLLAMLGSVPERTLRYTYAAGVEDRADTSEEGDQESGVTFAAAEAAVTDTAQGQEAADRVEVWHGGVAAVLADSSAASMISGAGEVSVMAAAERSEQEPLWQESEDEYANLAIADVTDYVNVRSLPSTDGAILGKIYDGAVAQIQALAGEENDWFQIISGSVEGYIKAEYFIYGDAAAEVVDQYVTHYVEVQVDRLNVRREPSTEAGRIGYIDAGESAGMLEDMGEWIRIQYTDDQEGYVSAQYVQISEAFTYAISIEEEQAQLAAERAKQERQQVSEESVPEAITNIVFPETTYSSNAELRQSIVDYAMQYLGSSYVHGGRSLASGTDCSGFTCYVYADFGYSISRTPSGQYSGAGRSISYEEIQPGDIICYSSNGGKSCTHVGLYIGDGQIIHAANSRKGVITSNADYDTIIGIRNVID